MKRLSTTERLHFAALLFTAASMPLDFHVGIWACIILLATSLAKAIAERRLGNHSLNRRARLWLLAPVVYWLVLAASLLWTNDLATGWQLLSLKLSLPAFSVAMLATDTGYLDENRRRYVGYSLLLAQTAVFLYFTGRAILRGLGVIEAGSEFDPRHHAYTALYASAALIFVYRELSRRWTSSAPWHRTALVLAAAIQILYIVLVNSRAGMIALVLVAAACTVHTFIMYRDLRITAIVGVSLAVGIFAATHLVPSHTNRISASMQNVDGDARVKIYHANLTLTMKNPLAGYGAGDYHAMQQHQYGDMNYFKGEQTTYNAHNQYVESLLAAGVPCLLALLAMLVAPLAAQRRPRFEAMLLVAVIALNLLFESMLERQMGLLFIGSVLAFLTITPGETGRATHELHKE